jgi:methionine salvage enolase-phosphatase E1
MEAESYQKIAAQIGIPPEEILFLTDIEKGVDFLLISMKSWLLGHPYI